MKKVRKTGRKTRRNRRFRRAARLKRPVLGQNTVYHYKRCIEISSVYCNNSTITTSTGAFLFQLAALPAYTDFTNLYNQYMITGVKLTFFPYVNSQNISQATTTSAGQFFYLRDDSVYAGFSDVANAMTYQGVKCVEGSRRPFSVYCKVRPFWDAPADAQPAVNGFSTMRNNNWINSNAPTVGHLGFRWLWDFALPLIPTSQFHMHVMCTYYVKFRKVA